MAMNFRDAMNTKLGEIERPPLIPMGTYRVSVKGVPDITTTQSGEYEMLDFQLQLVEAQGDVDTDDLAKYGGLTPNSRVRRRFMFNTGDDAAFKRTEFDLRRFLEDHLKCAKPEMSLKEAIDASIGGQCLAFIRHNPDKNDPEVKYNEVARTAPVE